MRDHSRHFGDRTSWAAVTAILILGAVLRFSGLATHSFWLDEGWSLHFAGPTIQDALTRIWNTRFSERYQPLYCIVLLGWRHLFGDGEVAVRSLSAALGIATLVAMLVFAARWFGHRAAMVTGIVLALSAFAVYYSQEARPYALLALIAALQLLSFSYIANGTNSAPRIRSVVAFAAITGVGAFGSLFVLFFTTALCTVHLAVFRRTVPWLRIWLPAGCACLPAILFYTLSSAARDIGTAQVTSLTQPLAFNAAFVWYGLLAGTTYGPPVELLHGPGQVDALRAYVPQLGFLLIVALALVGLTGWHLEGGHDRTDIVQRSRFLVVTAVIAYGLSLGLAAVAGFNWLPRHAAMLEPILATVIGAAVSAASVTGGVRLRRAAYVCLAALLIINTVSIWHYKYDERYRKDDYRGAARYLLQARGPADRSVMLWGLPDLLAYYGDTATSDGTTWTPDEVNGRLRVMARGTRRLFVVVNREFYWRNGVRLEATFDRGWVVAETKRLPYFRILMLERMPDHEGSN